MVAFDATHALQGGILLSLDEVLWKKIPGEVAKFPFLFQMWRNLRPFYVRQLFEI